MPRKAFTLEQIVAALRQIEVAIAQGKAELHREGACQSIKKDFLFFKK